MNIEIINQLRKEAYKKMLENAPKVKIKEGVECADIYKTEGRLVFQSEAEAKEHDEYTFGIVVGNSACYFFEADDYVLL